MQENKKQKQGHITKQNAAILALICLTVGFIIGVAYTSYKLKPSTKTTIAPEKKQAIDYGEKEIELKNELSQNPKNMGAWIQLGQVYFETNQYKRAIAAYQKSLTIEPDNADVLTELGFMYKKNRQFREAIKSFDEAIAADPKHEWARFYKGVVLMNDLNEKGNALIIWEELLSINPIFMSSKDQSLNQLIKHYREH